VGGVCAVITVVISILQVGGQITIPFITNADAQLDIDLEPTFGDDAATTSFSDDPLIYPMASGGPIDVSYLGSGCVGFAAQAPDFRFQWTGNGGLLRFLFVAGGDSGLVINAPDGSWHCNDDSYDTLNPTVDFPAGPSGRYDIWVTSYRSNDVIDGTLNITEFDYETPE
jgi:serine protease Do